MRVRVRVRGPLLPMQPQQALLPCLLLGTDDADDAVCQFLLDQLSVPRQRVGLELPLDLDLCEALLHEL